MAVRESLTPDAARGLVDVVKITAPPAQSATAPFGTQDLGGGDLTWTDSQGVTHSLRDGWFGAAPAGMALLWFGQSVPSPEWWWAAGQAINAATYPVCAQIFGTNLPDFRNRYLVGAQGGVKPVGSTGGSAKITVAQMPAHAHLAAIYRESMHTGSEESGGWFSGDAVDIADTEPTGGGQNYWPPYLAVNLIVKMG